MFIIMHMLGSKTCERRLSSYILSKWVQAQAVC